ncbi:MAG: hypothetical protein WA802_12175 [Terracidiphilus sp.]
MFTEAASGALNAANCLHRISIEFNPTCSCDPEVVLKIIVIVVVVVLLAASVFADYRWRQWMAERRRERQ